MVIDLVPLILFSIYKFVMPCHIYFLYITTYTSLPDFFIISLNFSAITFMAFSAASFAYFFSLFERLESSIFCLAHSMALSRVSSKVGSFIRYGGVPTSLKYSKIAQLARCCTNLDLSLIMNLFYKVNIQPW